MIKARALGRRLVDVAFASATWAAAIAGALWFYDWINRWYVVVALLMVFVVALMRGGHVAPAGDHRSRSVPTPLPLPRGPLEPSDADEWLSDELPA